jgi:CyaY protein
MSDFNTHYESAIQYVDAHLSALIDGGADLDFDRSGDVITIEFSDGEKCVITPQAPMDQLWISANYSGHRFNWSREKHQWEHEKTSEPLTVFLQGVIEEKL